ncbi:MAG: SDR family NAD(P)-dependent oxidoreductase [Oscillospiraceae bacterium]|nr:SDR family NAD(P)-dependent oxidoreductase [Oscillospiraceae bacterium]
MKTWLITGCSSGIGAGIAKAALENGDNVVVTARKPEALAELVKEYPERALAVALDVTDGESIRAAVAAALEKFGAIDVLVNNAGYGYRAAVEEGERADVNKLFETNVFGPVELIKTVLPGMRAQKSGVILNVSSIAAARSALGSGYYAASKAALELITDGLRKEVAPLGIQAAIIEPGAFRTHFYDTSLQGTAVKIGDYDEISGKNRKENVVNKGNQPGDPSKAGKVIVAQVSSGKALPVRLLLGSDAVKVVRGEMESRIAEIDAWADVSAQTDF